jgi:hypothetical protein
MNVSTSTPCLMTTNRLSTAIVIPYLTIYQTLVIAKMYL